MKNENKCVTCFLNLEGILINAAFFEEKKIIQQMQSSQQETLAFSCAAVEIDLFMWKPK